MTQAASKPYVSYKEYLEAEKESLTKHEWLDGVVYDMAGGTREHGRLQVAIGGELRNALRGRPCNVFSSDVKVRVQATGLATYPDASVVCGRAQVDVDDEEAIVNPLVIVEVLSDSTEKRDRGEKFAHYLRIPTLREYVLISQHTRRIEVFHRNADGDWMYKEAGAGKFFELPSLECRISVDDVYHDPLAAAADTPA